MPREKDWMVRGRCECALKLNDLKAALLGLAEGQREVAGRVAAYMGTASLTPSHRDAHGFRMSEEMQRLFGGQAIETGSFAECCQVGSLPHGADRARWLCTGVLVAPRVVLTSGRGIQSALYQRLPPNLVALPAQDPERTGSLERGVLEVAQIVRHPVEDVALLLLCSASRTPPIAFAHADEVAAAERLEVVGFGNDHSETGDASGGKRRVGVPMLAVRRGSENLEALEHRLGFSSRSEFVAGGIGSFSLLPEMALVEDADAGCAAYLYVNGEPKLAGVGSRLTASAMDDCGKGGIYVRVDALRPWIDETVASLPPPSGPRATHFSGQ